MRRIRFSIQLIGMAVLLTSSPAADAADRNVSAHAYFIARYSSPKTEWVVYTAPQGFTQREGNAFMFAPIDMKLAAKQTIESYLRSENSEFGGLFLSNLSEECVLKSREETERQVESWMESEERRHPPSRASKARKIVLLDPETGAVKRILTVPAGPPLGKPGRGAGAAY